MQKNIDFKDFIFLIGLIMTSYGLYCLYKPSMWLCVGIFLIYLALKGRW